MAQSISASVTAAWRAAMTVGSGRAVMSGMLWRHLRVSLESLVERGLRWDFIMSARAVRTSAGSVVMVLSDPR